MTTRRRQQSRGVAMLAVLVALLLLSVLASGFFLQARDSGSFAYVSMAQTVAANNAEFGLNEAVRLLRSAQLNPGTLTPCTQAQVDSNTCTTAFLGPLVSGPPAADLSNGGGIQYQYMVYRLDPGTPDFLATDERLVVRSTGFYGQSVNAPGLVTSIVEAEVQLGVGTGASCTGSYECF